jgi:hypothetical protein
MERRALSCFRGAALIEVPLDWLEGFDYDRGFASVGCEARIRFPAVNKAFAVSLYGAGDAPRVRPLTDAEATATHWGRFCEPWESMLVANVLGYGPVLALDTVPWDHPAMEVEPSH